MQNVNFFLSTTVSQKKVDTCFKLIAYSIQKLWLFYYQQFQYKVNRSHNYTLIHILWFFVYHLIVYCFNQTMSTVAYIITQRDIQKWCTGIITINQRRSLSINVCTVILPIISTIIKYVVVHCYNINVNGFAKATLCTILIC